MKKISICLMLLCITLGANAQILWKISGNDLSKPSYILGTHHLAPISIIDSIADFKQTLNAVEQVYGELVMEEMKNPSNLQKMQQAIVLPNDTTLSTLLSPAQCDSVAVIIKQLMGVDLTMVEKMKPAFLTSQLAVILAMKSIKGFNPQQQLDGWVQDEAKKQDKKIGSLETMDMQINILFNSQSLQRQAEQLYATVTHTAESAELAQEMTDAYMNQDLELLEAAMNKELGNECDALPEEKDLLIYNRNENWIKRMPGIMQERPTLFAVGVGHLIGKRGVLNLLKEQGYSINWIK
ncbi:TraB/GumN family protein [Phocaeicola vulgatus]|uniref:TraB/GumN family protein n=1 Tax=Phocaeicola vulgatus TaxID=821 RepID=UPI003DA380FC